MSNTDVARANWRADLHEYGSAALRAAGFDGMADEHEASAVRFREEASIAAALADAKETYRASEKTDVDRAAYNAAKVAVQNARRAIRETGAPRPGIVDNLSEPTAAELIEQGY